jgi:hypothetical protein
VVQKLQKEPLDAGIIEQQSLAKPRYYSGRDRHGLFGKTQTLSYYNIRPSGKTPRRI